MVLGQGNPFTRLANPLSTIAPTIAPVRLALADAAFAGSAVASASRAIVLDPQLLAESLKSARAGALEATPQPRSQSCKKVKRTITFTGCGGLWNYLFGVACYMQQNFEIDPSTTAFASASAGAYPAFLLAAGCRMRLLLSLVFLLFSALFFNICSTFFISASISKSDF